jgi:hypothetical protein
LTTPRHCLQSDCELAIPSLLTEGNKSHSYNYTRQGTKTPSPDVA